MDKNFRSPWLKPISYEEWKSFLAHDFKNPSREAAYKIINNYVDHEIKCNLDIPELAEIGFGQCYDFIKCFKELHDAEKIRYHGFDITFQFVKYTRELYGALMSYNKNNVRYHLFSKGGFYNLNDDYDIIYTRHTLEHQHPHDYKLALYKLLQATRELCIITWFLPPKDEEHIFWSETDGFGNSGCWANTYAKNQISEIIEQCDFQCEIIKAGTDEIYILRRND